MENQTNGNNDSKKREVKTTSKKVKWYIWPIKIFFLAFALSLVFSIGSEYLTSATGIVFSILIIILFISISIITDMIGVAVTACAIEPFAAMASKKVKGAKEAMLLIKNADKVASLCADVLGDVCGILSGAAGAAIVIKVTEGMTSNAGIILVASLISAFIAGLTIFGKALGKKFSLDNCNKIILFVGKCLSPFRSKKAQANQNKDSVKNVEKDNL